MGARDPSAAVSFSAGKHDHRACVARALRGAERVCARRGARLTKLRRRVLELVWSRHAPVGAYDLLRRLGREREGAAPPTVYRALDFLLAHGLIHRIESLSAFVGCANPDEPHAGQFLICAGCGTAAEFHDPRLDAAIARRADALGFAVRRKTIEVEGLCPPCQRRREVPADGK
ncbi:MAG: Fur family transcriptional regulator [Kiloniellaceae bacterium]